MRSSVLAVFAALLLASSALPQTVPSPSFEVASIKPAAPDARGMFIRPGPGGGVSITNMSLKDLIGFAWSVQPFQITGGPPWLDKLRFDIVAKSDSPIAPTQMNAMLQGLLKDRFQLVVTQEKKESSIYAIVLARKDGKLGPQLTETTEASCLAFDPKNPPPPPAPGSPRPNYCGNIGTNGRSLNAYARQIGDLAPLLSRLLGRTVIDKTGLTGKYDILLNWTPDDNQSLAAAPPGPNAPNDAAGASIFTAFQEQLGLKLEGQKGPVEMIVVQSVDKPSEN